MEAVLGRPNLGTLQGLGNLAFGILGNLDEPGNLAWELWGEAAPNLLQTLYYG